MVYGVTKAWYLQAWGDNLGSSVGRFQGYYKEVTRQKYEVMIDIGRKSNRKGSFLVSGHIGPLILSFIHSFIHLSNTFLARLEILDA